MPNLVCVGAQWGDEGKGKVVDHLSSRADLVVRYQGGPNAGHTVVAEGDKTVLHVIPSGILHPGALNLIGPGVVIDPELLIKEIDGLRAQGVDVTPARLRISDRAHLILPFHRSLDQAREEGRRTTIGTTGRGIGPAYEDRVGRSGIRVCDLLDPVGLGDRVRSCLSERNALLALYGWPAEDAEPLLAKTAAWAARLGPFVDDVSVTIDRALRDSRSVLFEGAQGTLLDIDHGTYPYVTSSTTVAGGACAGAGIGPTRIDAVLGISKAYTTRVGGGPFPTEDSGSGGVHLGSRGYEVGATTGRKRRCGWLDLVVLRHAIRVNGITSLALLKLDVLSGLSEVPVCTHYRSGGRDVHELPAHIRTLESCEPVYRTFPGWSETLSAVRSFDELPATTRSYISWIEQALEVPAHVLGIGPEREATIERVDPFALSPRSRA